MRRHLALPVSVVLCWTALTSVALVQADTTLPKGKPITLVVSTGPGGGYDLYARLFGRHFGRHLPGTPDIIVQNMPGAGGLRAMNFMYSTAPRDGTTIGLVHSTVPFRPIYGFAGADFDPTRVNWLGSMNKAGALCITWNTSKVKSIKDATLHEAIVGSVGAGSDMEIYPTAMNRLFRTKFNIIGGYKDGNHVLLAMERGEIDGRCGVTMVGLRGARPQWITDNKVNFVVQAALEGSTDPALRNVPVLLDLAPNNETRQVLQLLFANQEIDRPFLAPPDVPASTTRTLRNAFERMMKDPAFIEDAKKSNIEVDFVSGDNAEAVIKRVYALPVSARQAVIEATRR